MVKYLVSCYSPPSQLKIKQGDKVKVEGWMRKEKIRAEGIENVTESGPSCRCSTPPYMQFMTMPLPQWIVKTGIVGRVKVAPDSLEFELETP